MSRFYRYKDRVTETCIGQTGRSYAVECNVLWKKGRRLFGSVQGRTFKKKVIQAVISYIVT